MQKIINISGYLRIHGKTAHKVVNSCLFLNTQGQQTRDKITTI